MILNTFTPLLQVRGLSFRYPQQQVFHDFSASLSAGITYLIGDESTGKSTLLRLIAGELTAHSGDVNIHSISQAQDLAHFRKLVFWTDPRITAHENLSPLDYFDMQRKLYPSFDERVLTDMVQSLGLTAHLAKAIYMLSAGSKRKVWLAAAFASGTAVTLLDEPFAALDKASIGNLIEKLAQYSQDTNRVWIVADYEVPSDLSIAHVIDLNS